MPPNDDLIGFSTDILPDDFDPCTHPILARHFFGVAVLPRLDDAGELEAADVGEAA